jgi:hypothetical protein
VADRELPADERCYSRFVRKEDLVAFVKRDWGAIAALKRRTWAEQKSGMTAAEALHVGDELRNHIRTLQRDWPTVEDRRKDLASHVRVSEMLSRVRPSHRR